MSPFASLLLAAGAGTRLKPLTEAIPKPALPILDVPLGAFGLADLASLGSPIWVNVSHLHEVVSHALAPFSDRVEFVLELPEPLGSAGTLASLKERLSGAVVTRNADMFSDLSVAEVIATHLAAGTPATVATVPVTAGADLVVNEGRAVRLVSRKQEPRAAGHLWLGIAVFERPALDLIGAARPLDLASGLLAELIGRGQVAVHEHSGYAVDVGTMDRYLRANLDLLHGVAPAAPRGLPGYVVELEEGSAYVGIDAEVEESSLGSGACVMHGASVASSARIERSVVWPNEKVPDGTVVADAVWALGRSFDARGSSAPPGS